MLARRPDSALRRIEHGDVPRSPIVVDANLIGLTLRGKTPAVLSAILGAESDLRMPAPVLAELRHLGARLDPAHPQSPAILRALHEAVQRLGAGRFLLPSIGEWERAGDLAGQVQRLHGGVTRRIAAAERIEFQNDALVALLAIRESGTVLTNDRDFDLLQQVEPALSVVFFDQG